MGARQEVKVQTRGPDEGNPTPMWQGRRPGAPGRRDADSTGRDPVRGGLVEAVGVRPFRAKAKRREASAAGEPALSGEARYSSELQAYGRRDGRKVWRSYLGRSAGLRGSGSS